MEYTVQRFVDVTNDGSVSVYCVVKAEDVGCCFEFCHQLRAACH